MAREPYAGHVSMFVTKKNGYYDLELDDQGRVKLIRGPHEIAQAAELRMSLWRGGWCLDLAHGFPWTRFIGRKDVSQGLLKGWMRKVLLRDKRIRRIFTAEVVADHVNRVWSAVWTGESANQDALTHEFVVNQP